MNKIRTLLVCIAMTCLIAGCGTLAPNANPLVVRVEQTETVALATFDTFLKIDDANRLLMTSNAPAVHAFAEKLRQPVMDGTNVTRQGLLWITQLDRLKVQYKSGTVGSNAVVNALAIVENALATAQQDIVTFGGH